MSDDEWTTAAGEPASDEPVGEAPGDAPSDARTGDGSGPAGGGADDAAERDRLRVVAGSIWLLLITMLAYLPTAWCGFIWDDDQYILDNTELRSVEGLVRIWLSPTSIPQYYPMVHTTYWLEYSMWGLNPLGYHVVNVLVHAFAAIALFHLLRRLGVPGAWVGAALFAIHPVHVESVAWVTERKNTLSAVFYFLSALALLPLFDLGTRPKPAMWSQAWWARYVGGFALFVGALLSKSVTCSLPAALLVVVWWKRGVIRMRDVAMTLPFFVVGLAAGLHTAWLEKQHVGAVGSDWDYTFFERCLIAGRALWFYATKLVWPHPLIFSYERWHIDQSILWLWWFPITFAAVTMALLLLRNRIGRAPLAAVLLFAGTLFPALGFFNVYPFRYSFVADHFQYHASVALLVLLASTATIAFRRWAPQMRALPAATAGIIIAVLMGLSFLQCFEYRDHETLYAATIRKNPESLLAHNNLGVIKTEAAQALKARGEDAQAKFMADRAVALLKRGLEIRPDAVSHANLAIAQREAGNSPRAVELLRRSIELEPQRRDSYVALATTFKGMGKPVESARTYREQLERFPTYWPGMNNLARLLLEADELRDPDEALRLAEQAAELSRRRSPQAMGTLAAALAANGRLDEAIKTVDEALDLTRRGGEKWLGYARRLGEARLQYVAKRESKREVEHQTERLRQGGVG